MLSPDASAQNDAQHYGTLVGLGWFFSLTLLIGGTLIDLMWQPDSNITLHGISLIVIWVLAMALQGLVGLWEGRWFVARGRLGR